MVKTNFDHPVDLKDVRITDGSWHAVQETVRREVLPYQWRALNDQVEGAEPSWCIHNFKAAAYSLILHPDPALERTVDEAVELICAAQDDSGYLDTYYLLGGMDRRFTNLRDHHELYCLGHLIEAAAACWQATGKDELLRSACRFADCAVREFGPEPGKRRGYPGHEIAEMALARLYEVTGERKYLDLCRFFLDQRGTQPYYFDEEARLRDQLDGRPHTPDTDPLRYAYQQAHLPVREQREAVGHAVRAGYLCSGMADAARLTGDEVALDFPMEIRMRAADRRVREDTGKAAFTRGPITYCMEEADNGPDLHLLLADARRLNEAEAVPAEICGQKMTALEVPGLREEREDGPLYTDYAPGKTRPVTLRLIPYYAWANRGEGEMRVWVRVRE